MGALSWSLQGERRLYHKKRETSETQQHQRLNKYQDPTTKLNSEAHCYKQEEDCSNGDILNRLRRKLWTCWESATVETRSNKNSFMTNNRTVTEKYRGTELRCVHQELHVVPTQELPSHIWDYEAGQRLMEFCQENTLLIANTLFQQHKWRLYTWISPDGQYQNQTDYILCSQKMEKLYAISKNKTGNWLWLRSWTPYYQIHSDLNWRKCRRPLDHSGMT